jgi:peptidoglycan/LPS O-acetylase OafA/YrhL
MHDTTTRSTCTSHAVDNTDWLKTVAIILVAVDHFGHFFVTDNLWWSAFGRLAAPPFFFLMGYAQTRAVPIHWIGLGIILTLLDSWNSNWSWVAPNILLSFALIRLARPYVEIAVLRYGWAGCVLLVLALVASLPVARPLVDYGAEGWLWALLGLCQRIFVDDRSRAGPAQRPASSGLMRLLVCVVAAVIYIWQEQREYSFPQMHFAVFVAGVAILSAVLCLFTRGPSYIQPPEAAAGLLRFIGRRTLEIYAIQLAGSEIITLLR